VRVFITGGTGFVGRTLAGKLLSLGHGVTVLSRREAASRGDTGGVEYARGDPNQPGPWQDIASEHDTIVNLAGRSIFARWTAGVKREIRDSRVRITRNVVDAIARREAGPAALLNASAVGYYGFRGDEFLNEEGPKGSDFLASVCGEWEDAAMGARRSGARVALCRFGIVLGKRGGALAQMLKTYRHLPVSPLGGGKQWFSWIHQTDLVEALSFIIEHPEMEGPVNCTAPGPLRNRDFMKALAEAMGRRAFRFGVPAFALAIAMGEFGKVLLEGQRVLPRKLIDGGFEFSFPEARLALLDLLGTAEHTHGQGA
jgi:uncharacterized protein (TIGR01777 family)